MAENTTIGDLNKILQDVSQNQGVLANINTVCGVINKLNLDEGGINNAKIQGIHLKNFCNQALKPILTGLQSALTESKNLTDIGDISVLIGDQKNAGNIGVLSKIETTINSITSGVLNLENSDALKINNDEEINKLGKAVKVMDNVKKSLNSYKSGLTKLHGGISDFLTSIQSLNNLDFDEENLTTITDTIVTIFGSLDGFGENGVLNKYFKEDSNSIRAIDAWKDLYNEAKTNKDSNIADIEKSKPASKSVIDILISRVQLSTKTLNNLSKALYVEGAPDKGLSGAFNALNKANSNIADLNIGNIENVAGNVLSVLKTIDGFGENGVLNKYFKEDSSSIRAIDAWKDLYNEAKTNKDSNIADIEKSKPASKSVIDVLISRVQLSTKTLNNLSKALYIDGAPDKGLNGAFNALNKANSNMADLNIGNIENVAGNVLKVLKTIDGFGENGVLNEYFKEDSSSTRAIDAWKDLYNEAKTNKDSNIADIEKSKPASKSVIDVLISRVQLSTKALNTFSKALYIDGAPDKGLNGAFNALNKANSNMADLNIGNIENVAGNVLKVLKTIDGFGAEDLNKYFKEDSSSADAIKVWKDLYNEAKKNKDSNIADIEKSKPASKSVIDVLISRVQLSTKALNTFSKALYIDGAQDKGLYGAFNALNKALGAKWDTNNVNEANFKKITDTIACILNGMQLFADDFNDEGIKKADNAMKMLKGGESLGEITEKISVKKNNKGEEEKVTSLVENKTVGLLPTIASFIKTISVLMAENGLFATINNLNINNLPDQNKIKLILTEISKYINQILSELLELNAYDEEWVKLAVAGDEIIQKIQNITSSINGILTAINDIVDIKKNPFLNPMKMLFVKKVLEHTFFMVNYLITGVIYKELILLNKKINKDKIKAISEVTENIHKITQSINGILKDLCTMPAQMLIFIALSPIIIIGLFIFSILIWGIVLVLQILRPLSKMADNTKKIVDKIKSILTSLNALFAAVALSCVILAAFAIFSVKYYKLILAGLAAMLLMILALALTVQIMKFIFKGVKVKDILSIMLVISAITIIIGLLYVISFLLIKLQEQAKQIEILTIILFLVGFIVLVAIFAALGWLCTTIAPVLVPGAIAMLLVSMTMVVIVGALFLIAYLLNKLSEITLDPNAISNVVNTIFDTANSIINAIFKNGRDEPKESAGKESWWKSALKWLGDSATGKLFKALMTMVYLAQILASVYLIKWIANCLNELQEIKLDKNKVNSGVDLVLTTADSLVKNISKYGDGEFKKAQKNLNKYETITKSLVNIQKRLIAAGNAKLAVDGCNNLITVVAKFNDTFNKIDDTKAVRATNSYIGFLKRVDNMKLKNLETAAKMFEEMARFSESINGNFDQLAQTINEKIAPLLEELKESVGKVAENSNKPTDMQAEKEDIKNQMQASGQIRNMTDKEINNKVNNKYNERQQQKLGIDEITEKLTALINLFQSGEAIVRTS